MPTLVLGVGNVLMGDEGVGVHAAVTFAAEPWPDHVSFLDGGTGGFHLLSYLQDYRRVIMIDATLDDAPPGTVTTLRPRYATDFPRSLSAHDIGLRDLVEAAALLGPLPDMTLITVSVAAVQPMVLALSASIEAAIPLLRRRLAELVVADGVGSLSLASTTCKEPIACVSPSPDAS
ncbi:MAG: hydrogenase maturation protease [Vicinamibacterales bacterium]